MKSASEWFAEYSVSHQNKKNQAIHYVCVPAIFFSVVGLLMSIPHGILRELFKADLFWLENWAVVALLCALIFYFQMSVKIGLELLLFSACCIAGNYLLSEAFSLWQASLLIFVVAWIGQFYGHKIEGKKPSFLKDLQFLLIGPAWVIHKMFN
ncbi:MAG: Mpo1-like protein [Gillisia sp.]